MELIESLRTTGAIRDFLPDPIPDEDLHRILDNARFAPSGGNRQGWRVVIVKDTATRRALRDLYLPGWYELPGTAGRRAHTLGADHRSRRRGRRHRHRRLDAAG